MKNVLAIDPGQTTGIAIKLNGSYTTCVANSPEEVWELVSKLQWDTVICENFATAGRISTYGLLTVRTIGGIQAICWKYKLPLVMRMPQHRYSKQAKAKEANIATTIHEQDALAHLLSWEASYVMPK